MRKFFVPALCVLIICAAACTSKQSRGGGGGDSVLATKTSDRKAAADFSLKDENGATVQLADYRGKVVLLNFWATWCGPCQVEIPWFTDFEQKYKSQGFAVLGVSMDDDGWSAIKPFIAEHKVNYRILLGNDSVAQLYNGLDSLPTSFIIDREGKVAFPPHIGLISKNEYVSEIECLLRNQPTTSVASARDASTSANAACPAK